MPISSHADICTDSCPAGIRAVSVVLVFAPPSIVLLSVALLFVMPIFAQAFIVWASVVLLSIALASVVLLFITLAFIMLPLEWAFVVLVFTFCCAVHRAAVRMGVCCVLFVLLLFVMLASIALAGVRVGVCRCWRS